MYQAVLEAVTGSQQMKALWYMLDRMPQERKTTANKRFFRLLKLPVVLIVVANCGQVRAKRSSAFTAVFADYFGCDPSVKSTTSNSASCLPKANYTRSVDRSIGTAMVNTNPSQTITLINKNDGTHVQAQHEIKAYYTMKLNMAPPTQRDANCATPGTTLLGQESILGIETYKYRRGEVEPGNAASTGVDGSISWLAPSPNCFALRTEAHYKGSPTTFQVTSNVTPGTPPASAFEPPAGFVELSQMEVQHKSSVLMMQRFNPAMTAEEAETAWVNTSATNIGMQRQEAVWRKQHDLTQ